jgi:transcriptional regulator with XRE-family HTH domain
LDEQLARAIGERVQAHRTTGRRKQTVVAGLTGITADYLYQIERGMKLPTITVLARLAEVLGVSVAELLGQESTASGRTSQVPAGETLYRALTSPMPATSEPPSVVEVHARVTRAWWTWQTSPQRYSQLAGQLPQLIIDMELAVQVHQAETATSFRYAKGCAVDLYSLVRTVSKRLGRFDLSLLAADRAVRAAEAADDPLRLGLARWNLAHVLLADGLSEDAELVAMRAADALRPLIAEGGAETAAVYGALLLLGAAAVARQGNTWTAHSRLREAAPLADRTGECNTLWTAFGPTNVAMYSVTVEIEAGEVLEGLDWPNESTTDAPHP